jgi:hypothetical protein
MKPATNGDDTGNVSQQELKNSTDDNDETANDRHQANDDRRASSDNQWP